MKALRVPAEGLIEGVCALDADASNYVLRVHRVSVGSKLRLFEPGLGVEAEATLVGCRGRTALCEVSSVVAASAVPRRELVLMQAYAKGDKVERVVRDATALGATAIVIVVTERSIVQLDGDESSRRGERFRRIAIEAARQCGRGNIPAITGPVAFEHLLREPPPWPLERWVLSPNAEQSLGARMQSRIREPVAVFIGPEGGLAEREIAELSRHGFLPVRFSDFVLRTETAATAVLGAVAAWV